MANKPAKKYEILEQASDLKLKAYGRDLADLFSNALRGMFGSAGPIPKKGPSEKKERKIEIRSVDAETLLIDFLNEALYLSDSYDEAYLKARFSKIDDTGLKGEIEGMKTEGFSGAIKAATGRGIGVVKKGDRWEATIIFDI